MSSRPAAGPLWHARVSTALGRLMLAGSSQGLCYLSLLPEGDLERLAGWARRHAPGMELREEPEALGEAARQLREYADGSRRSFDLALDLRGTDFQRSVWDELLAIPFGRTRSYGELAQRLGKPGASRAIGGAAGANPVAVVVPCHRLLAGDGLGGFSGGMQNKRNLLALEGHPSTPSMF